jgi:hypothetical protein
VIVDPRDAVAEADDTHLVLAGSDHLTDAEERGRVRGLERGGAEKKEREKTKPEGTHE